MKIFHYPLIALLLSLTDSPGIHTDEWTTHNHTYDVVQKSENGGVLVAYAVADDSLPASFDWTE